MAFKTWATGDVLTAADLNTLAKAPGTFKIKAGTTAYSLSTESQKQITVTYGETFSTILAFIPAVKSSASDGLVCMMDGDPGTTSAVVLVYKPGGGNTTRAGNIHWIVVGT